MRTPKRKLIRFGLVAAIFLFGAFGIVFHKTFKGIYEYKVGKWQENAFKGKPLTQLVQDLETRQQTLNWCDMVGFRAITDRDVSANQRVMIFLRGKPYPWFWIGTAQNAGYVVIQNSTNGEIVVDIIRTAFVDSP